MPRPAVPLRGSDPQLRGPSPPPTSVAFGLPQVDIYSFGVVLWELVTKEMPRRGFLRDVRVPDECPQVRRRAQPQV